MGTCALVGTCALLSPACDKFQGRSGGVNVGGASEPHGSVIPGPEEVGVLWAGAAVALPSVSKVGRQVLTINSPEWVAGHPASCRLTQTQSGDLLGTGRKTPKGSQLFLSLGLTGGGGGRLFPLPRPFLFSRFPISSL